MCWPALALFALAALGRERLGAAWLMAEKKVDPMLPSAALSFCSRLCSSCEQAIVVEGA